MAVVTMECTKRASAMGLWGVWSVLGKSFFESLIDRVICVAKDLHHEIEQAEDFESWGTPSCNIVLFRYCGRSPFPGDGDEVNAFQLRLRRKMLEAGAGYLTQTKVDGQIYLRATIMNPIVDIDDLKAILHGVRTAAEDAVAGLFFPHAHDRLRTLFAARDLPSPETSRLAALRAIGRVNTPEALEFICERLRDGDPRFTEPCRTAIGRLTNPELVPVLRTQMDLVPATYRAVFDATIQRLSGS